MLKKILLGVLIFLGLILAVVGIYYWQMTEKNKPPISDEDRPRLTVMPLPAKAVLSKETFTLASFNYFFKINREDRVSRALERLFNTLNIPGTQVKKESEANLIIDFHHETDSIQKVIEDESYILTITSSAINLVSENAYGILRGLETLKQIPQQGNGSVSYIQGKIDDSPRYPWRGLMLDVSRHWIPKETILRNLDAMAVVKLNVLHWHLSDYQGFRIESKVFPKLHEEGSNGKYYLQDDIKEVIAYARDRGIRVIPEFDMPGHATSWFAGYPELAVTSRKYTPDKTFGILTPIMDPTSERVYQFLDKFIGEMAALFPDAYFHIGGDEVSPVEWNNSSSIQAFMKTNEMKDHHDLQHYFNKRVQQIAAKHGKHIIGWDEVLHPEMDSNVVVQAWRAQKRLWESAQSGHASILSAGYYLDHKLPAGKHYLVDPEILPGAVTITPDTRNWKEWDLKLKVSDNIMETKMVLYGKDTLRGLFILMENATGFEKAELIDDNLQFSFRSEFGTIDVEGTLQNDSIRGSMSLGFLSFPFEGIKTGGSDMPGTKAPVFEKINPLSHGDKQKIIGGEAALWTEFVTNDNIDSRLWPRAAAIAEKLWTPAVLTKNVPDMYRRLELTDLFLQQLGMHHHSGPGNIVKQWGVDPNGETIKTFLQAVEEVKYYDRFTSFSSSTTETPLNEVVDAALPESLEARRFNEAVNVFMADTTHRLQADYIKAYLGKLVQNHQSFTTLAVGNATLQKVIPVSANLDSLARLALEVFNSIVQGSSIPLETPDAAAKQVDELLKPQQGIVIAIGPGVKKLVTGH
jgi:hexosaminidase